MTEVAVYTDKVTHITERVRRCSTIYSVCYEGEPVELFSEHLLSERARHKRTLFTNERSALRLATRLNVRYRTDKFSVQRLTVYGEKQA